MCTNRNPPYFIIYKIVVLCSLMDLCNIYINIIQTILNQSRKLHRNDLLNECNLPQKDCCDIPNFFDIIRGKTVHNRPYTRYIGEILKLIYEEIMKIFSIVVVKRGKKRKDLFLVQYHFYLIHFYWKNILQIIQIIFFFWFSIYNFDFQMLLCQKFYAKRL